MEEHKDRRTVLSHWGNDRCQTYRTLGQAAEISEIDTHLLMNHALAGVLVDAPSRRPPETHAAGRTQSPSSISLAASWLQLGHRRE